MTPKYHVAVIGGGITGLSTAWHLARSLPPATLKITLLEGRNRLGGWIRSTRMGDEQVLFESGPRTLRPNGEAGLVTLEMISALGLSPSVTFASKTSRGARNRFIYRSGSLLALPSSLPALLFSQDPLLRSVVPCALRELFRSPCQEPDESIDSFFRRRFGPQIADSLASALVHGIYAGDSRNISVKSAFRFLWDAERRRGSVGAGMIFGVDGDGREKAARERLIRMDPELVRIADESSLYSFVDGLGVLVEALERDLRKRGVEVVTRAGVARVRIGVEGVEILHSKGSVRADHVVSTISSGSLSKLLTSDGPHPSPTVEPDLIHALKSHSPPTVSVAVTNFVYGGRDVLPISGFGYLVPRSDLSDHDELGVIFDSSALPAQDLGCDLTRLTVMMGGHVFESKFGPASAYDSEEDGGGRGSSNEGLSLLLVRAREVLRKRLDLTRPEIRSLVRVHRDCIPQYPVGHWQKSRDLHEALARSGMGRVSVAGSSFTGVAVNELVRAGRELAEALAIKLGGRRGDEKRMVVTGLETFLH